MNGVLDQLTREGFSYLQRGEIREAELRFRAAIAANSANANALHGLAIIAHQTGHFQPAIELFDRAIAADASLAAAYVNRGNAQFALQRFADAIESHRTALQLSPDLNSARINMASALQAVGRIDEAVAVIEQALHSAPDSAEIHNNLGNLYKEQGRLQDAIRCYAAALRLNPTLPQAASNRLAAMKLDPALSPADILDAHREWSAWFEAVSTSVPVLINTLEPTRKIRIGYVSPDCHGALPAFIDPVIAGHDRERFEVYCYFNNPQSPESLAARGVASTACILKGATDEEIAKKIHDDGIDILIDIAGHTGQNRLGVFARRPAPVQITWLDYLGTTGLAAMDYRLTDIVADPLGNENFHTEKSLRMPHTQWCWRPDENARDVVSLPALKNGYITFGSFNNAIKLTDATLNLWRQLLVAMPSARLRVAGIAEGFARQRIIELLSIDQARLEFLPRVGVREYRESFGLVDVALDPMPFSGATTTLDALWQGVPVLTLPGATSCSRSSASLLTAIGLDSWIAKDAEDWLQRATRMCADVNALAQLRAGLRERVQSSALVDFKKFVGDLETHYAAVWKVWCIARASPDLEIAGLEQAALSDANSNLLNDLGRQYLRQARLTDAVRSFEAASRLDSRQHFSMSNKIAALRADPTISDDKLFALHREWSDRFEFHASSAPLLVNSPEPNRKLRIGYVSVDPQQRLATFINPVLQSHDHCEFEIFWFDDASPIVTMPGVITRSLVDMDDDQAAQLIHQDGIDILIDLSGHGESHRMGVFARRVAPVQISWLGYQCDTAMNGISHWIGDAINDSFDQKNNRFLRLPDASFCWQPDADAPKVNAPPILTHGYITFGYFSEASRLSDFTLALWCRLLAAMPQARMVIANIPAGFAQREVLKKLNCDANRIDFLSDAESLADEEVLDRVDIVLDAMGLSDPLTTMRAMWQGVPVLTLASGTFCSRATASVLIALGMDEWIARDETQWLAQLLQHAANVAMLTTLRQSLRERLRTSTLLDAKKFTRDLEAVYKGVWRDWCGARIKANASPSNYLGCDGAVIATKAALDSGRINEGVATISAVLKTRPDWALAKTFAMGAYMGWAQTHPEAKSAWRQITPTKVKRTKVSAIVCSIRPDYFVQIKAALETQFAAHSVEIIGIHDATSLAEGYNRGAAKASGDILIFCHDDIDFVQADFGTRVLHHLQTSDVIGVAGTSRLTGSAFMDSGYPNCCGQIIHARQDWRKPDSILFYFVPGIQGLVVEGIQALDGVFIATHRRVWEAIKYDEAEFDGFHLYDVDFTYRAYLAGLRLMVPMDLLLVHFSDGTYSPTWQRYANRFLAKFPTLDVPPNVLRGSPINARLRSIQQIELLHTGLLHHRFGS